MLKTLPAFETLKGLVRAYEKMIKIVFITKFPFQKYYPSETASLIYLLTTSAKYARVL